MTEDAEARIRYLTDYMDGPEEPEESIGEHCFNPYGCGFWKYCTGMLPRPNVFDLSGMQNRSKFKYYRDGIISFEQLEEAGKLQKNYLTQVRHELHGQEAEIHKDVIESFLAKLSYPLYFLDFETFQTAVPLFDRSRPYEQIPFQYSLHYIEKENGECLHREYLADPGEDPRRGVAESLCRDIPADVCVMAYNMGFEKGRIKRMAELFPDLSEHLTAIHDHIVDLMVPFKEKAYYCRDMQGSYSIKYVLPVLFPGDPALDYHNLNDVHNGAEASDAFSRMQEMEPEERERYRASLLKYCELDTLAMVKIWEKLAETVR